LKTEPPLPARGEIWLVALDPTVGAEMQKTRPAVVVSSDAVAKLPLKLVVPITGWKDHFAQDYWHVQIAPSSKNGLTEISAIDALQTRCVDRRRLIRKIGRVTATIMEQIASAIAIIIEYG
jgi:mRNA interferase MazF